MSWHQTALVSVGVLAGATGLILGPYKRFIEFGMAETVKGYWASLHDFEKRNGRYPKDNAEINAFFHDDTARTPVEYVPPSTTNAYEVILWHKGTTLLGAHIGITRSGEIVKHRSRKRGSSMRSVPSIITLLALTGCSDEVTARFDTLAEAKSQGALARGWLPPLLPDSAKAIVERNNLDLNTGTGSFDYDLSERPAYIEKLSSTGAESRTGAGMDILTVTTNGSRWEVRLPRTSGSAEWWIRRS